MGSRKSKAGKILEVKCKNETWTRVKTRKRERKKENNLGKEEERGDTKRERERGRKRFLMLIYECLTVVSWNKWLVGVAAALLPVQDTKCIVRSAIRPNLHM